MFPGVVAMGDAGKRTPAHIGGGLDPATPLQAPGKGSKGGQREGVGTGLVSVGSGVKEASCLPV